MDYSAVTITFCDCAENHVGMEKVGRKDERGYELDDLLRYASKFPASQVELIDLRCNHSMEEDLPEAYVLVVRKAVGNHEEVLKEMLGLEWDTKALMRGRVVNKHARHNVCFQEEDDEPDYENGKGRKVAFRSVLLLNGVRTEVEAKMEMSIEAYSATKDESVGLKAEGNLYYDVNKCGIGYHGDSERKKVIGVRLGAPFPLVFRWYRNGEREGEPIQINLESGDMYVMSEKATGFDWKKRREYTLRHAAGCSKYIA